MEGKYGLEDIMYYGYIEHPVKGRCIYGSVFIKNHDTQEGDDYGFCVINSSNYPNKGERKVLWEPDLSIDEPTSGENNPLTFVPEEFLAQLELKLTQMVAYRQIEVLNGFIIRDTDVDKGVSTQPSQTDKTIMFIGMVGGFIIGFIAKALF